jgi:hypothetical protein
MEKKWKKEKKLRLTLLQKPTFRMKIDLSELKKQGE